MRSFRVTPQTVLTTPDGRLTRDGFDLLASVVDRLNRPGIPTATAAEIASISSFVNKLGSRKDEGLLVLDTTNSRIMMSRGSAPTSVWESADGSVSVTPS